MRVLRWGALLTVLATLGCEATTEAPQVVQAPGGPSNVSFAAQFSANDVIRIVDNTGAMSSHYPYATASWNSAVLSYFDLPRFSQSGYNQTVTLQWGTTNGTGWYCGTADVSNRIISIHRSSAATNCGDPGNPFTNRTQTNLGGLIAHELSHILGFNGHISNNSTGPTGSCLNTLDIVSHGFNSSPCQWEIQTLFEAYGHRTGTPSSNQYIVTETAVGPDWEGGGYNLTVGGSSETAYSWLSFSGGNGYAAVAPDGNESITWSASPSGIVSLTSASSGQVTVNPVAPGTATITATINSSSRFDIAQPASYFYKRGAVVQVLGAAPSGVGSNSVTAVAANVSWTNGVSSVVTKVEYAVAGSGSYSSVNSSSGATSASLSGLSPNTAYDIRLTHMSGATPISGSASSSSLFTTLTGPTGSPSSVGANSINGSAATVTWTNGDNNAATEVRYRVSGIGSYGVWTTTSTGATSSGLTGLSACTTYDVRLTPVRNGAFGTATTATSLFTTTASGGGACSIDAPSSVIVADCFVDTYGVKQYSNYLISWTAGANPGTGYDVGENTSNNSAGATVIFSGSSATTSQWIGPYLKSSNVPRYIWVRHTQGGITSTWTALGQGYVDPTEGCLQ